MRLSSKWPKCSELLGALPQLEVFTPQSLVKIPQNLDHFLPTLLVDTQLKLQTLSSPKTVAVIIQKAVD